MNAALPLSTDLEEVFRTESGCVYQSDLENCFYVAFAGKTVKYKVKCFFRLKATVDKIDLARMACDVDRASDVEIITMCACEHCFVLTLPQIIALRELLAGTVVMLELNTIIHDRIHRAAITKSKLTKA